MLTFQGILFGTFAVVLVGNFPKLTKTIFLLNPLRQMPKVAPIGLKFSACFLY
jgi:hypothetical protein